MEGGEIQALVEELYKTPPEVVERVRPIFRYPRGCWQAAQNLMHSAQKARWGNREDVSPGLCYAMTSVASRVQLLVSAPLGAGE